MLTFSSLRPDGIGSLAILGLLVGALNPAFAWQASDAPAFEPKIVVLLGEDGINVIHKTIAASSLVEVRDQYDVPIAGAEVRFSLPPSGPGGVFENGAKDLSLVSDPLGRAAMGEMRPIGKGIFKITVSASYKGRTATAAILQTNFPTVASANRAGKTPGTSASDAPGATRIKLPSGAMAMSGGTAAILVVSAAAIGASVYYLVKNKSASVVSACVLNSLVTTEYDSCDEGSDDSAPACLTGAQLALSALENYCSCAGATVSTIIQTVAQIVGYNLSGCGQF